MKQNIDLLQVQSLNQQGRHTLLKWLASKGYGIGASKDDYDDLMLLSIGQMIEFLQDHGNAWWHIQSHEVNIVIGDRPSDYEGHFTYIGSDGRGTKTGYSVCDALWQSVKEVLEASP